MLTTKQQLESDKFYQSTTENLSLSGLTYFESLSGKSFSIKDNSLIGYVNDSITTESMGDDFASYFTLLCCDLLPNNNIRSLISNEDYSILYFATFGGGLWKIDLNSFTSETYSEETSNYDSTDGIIKNQLFSLSYKDGFLYIASSTNGFSKFDTINNVVTDYTNVSSNYSGDTLPSVPQLVTYIDPSGENLWLVSTTQGFTKFNIATNFVTRYTNASGNYSGATLANSGRNVLVLNDNVWFVTTSGLYKLDTNTNLLTLYNASSGNYSGDVLPVSGLAYILSIGDEIWVSHSTGTNGGYWKLNTLTNVATRYSSSSNNYYGDRFSTTSLNSPIYDSSSNTLYGICSGGGISKFDLTTLTNENALINGYINGNLNASDRLFYKGDGSYFTTNTLFVGRSTGSNGFSTLQLTNSTSGIYFNEFGLHYNQQPLSTLDTVIPTKKYVDDLIPKSSGTEGTIQLSSGNGVFGGSSNFTYDSNNRLTIGNNVAEGSQSIATGNLTGAYGITSFAGGSDVIVSGTSSFGFGSTIRIDGINSVAFGRQNSCTHNYTFSSGLGNTSSGQYSTTFGRAVKAAGSDSFAAGSSASSSGDTSISLGAATKAIGSSSFAQNLSTEAHGSASHAQNISTKAYGSASTAIGRWTVVSGDSAFVGGFANDSRPLQSHGKAAFNFSENTFSQIIGHGALANNSVILGGLDHHIASGNTKTVILGGDSIKLSGSSYANHVVVPQLAIWTIPTGGSATDRILVYNDATKKVKSLNHLKLATYTVATVPNAATVGAGTMIYVSNESGGSIPAFSDGTDWRRFTDREIISA